MAGRQDNSSSNSWYLGCFALLAMSENEFLAWPMIGLP